MDLPFGKCRILGLRAMIEAKEAMGRPHDLLTAMQLRAIEEKLAGGQTGGKPTMR